MQWLQGLFQGPDANQDWQPPPPVPQQEPQEPLLSQRSTRSSSQFWSFGIETRIEETYEERFQKTMLLLVFPGFRTSHPGRSRRFDSILMILGALES